MTDFNGHSSGVSNTADGLPSALTLGASGDSVDDRLCGQRRRVVDHTDQRLDPPRVRLLGRPVWRRRQRDRHAVEFSFSGRLRPMTPRAG